MSYINTTAGVYVFINGTDVSEYLIDGELSDSSAYTNQIVTTTGNITLGTSTGILDFNRSTFPIGSKINIYVGLDNGDIALHPKGTLYVINSTVNIEEKQLLLDVGCSLAFISDKEDSYTSAVEGLFTAMLSAASLKNYIVEDKNLSELSSILEVEGAIIYQDQYGNIQKVNAFGTDGLGVSLSAPKFTSFDKYTAISIESISDSAIENGVSAVTVEASVDVPSGDDAYGPEGLVESTTYRTIETPWVYLDYNSEGGNVWIDNEQASSVLISENNPNCGTIDDPLESPSGQGSSYKTFGDILQTNYDVKEVVKSGKYAEYEGPGNQVSREENWEWCSASTWAKTALSNSLNAYTDLVETLKAEADGLLSKANQHFDKRDEQSATLTQTTTYVRSWDGQSYTVTTQVPNSRYIYHNCNGEAFYAEAKDYARQASYWASQTHWLPVDINTYYGLSNLSQTFYTYGKAGEVVKKVAKQWQHALSFNGSALYELFFIVGGSITSTSTNFLVNRDVPTTAINNPTQYELKLASETITTYEYKTLYTVEIEEYIDYFDSSNSYRKVSYSASGSSNADQPDRLVYPETSDGTKYCSGNAEQQDISVTVPVINENPSVSTNWFGSGQAYVKTVSLPVTLAPATSIYNESTESCDLVNSSSILLRYESLIKNYAYIIAKKISGDNRGFRITEKMRPELFEYYPFFPVAISVESIGRAFTARVAAGNWVFDSENALCSFDCLLTGDIPQPIFAEPSANTVYLKTEATKLLTTSNLSIYSTANSVKLTSLPADGDLYLDGAVVSEGDSVDVADISAGLLSFVPTAAGTSEINLTYEAYDSSVELLSSIVNTYPPVTTILIVPANYNADGGEFTLNTSTNGLDCDGGNLDSATTNGGVVMEAGDFDTGTTVTLPAPSLPSGVPSGNNSVDPETEYGVNVKDNNDSLIATTSLATSNGEIDIVYDIGVILNINATIIVNLVTTIFNNAGWDYGYFEVELGTPIDLGTFADPNDYDLDFGSFAAATEPLLESSVV